MIVRFTIGAKADLRAVGDYIALDNPRRARTFVRELRLRCAKLNDYPRRFPLVEGHEESGVRHFVHGSYMIFYRVGEKAVEILRVLHGAQEYGALLFPD